MELKVWPLQVCWHGCRLFLFLFRSVYPPQLKVCLCKQHKATATQSQQVLNTQNNWAQSRKWVVRSCFLPCVLFCLYLSDTKVLYSCKTNFLTQKHWAKITWSSSFLPHVDSFSPFQSLRLELECGKTDMSTKERNLQSRVSLSINFNISQRLLWFFLNRICRFICFFFFVFVSSHYTESRNVLTSMRQS